MTTIEIKAYNNTLFAYTTMLRQLGAHFSDAAIVASNLEIEELRVNLGKLPEINYTNVDQVKSALRVLRLCVLNLQITVINRGYAELAPICEALSTFFETVQQDLKNAGLM